jgi:predicted GNAT family acetyltransferase
MEFRSVGMEGILVGKSRFTYADKETEIVCKNSDIRCYNDGDCYRFVFYKNRRAVAGIHFQKNFQGYAIVSSAFTKQEHRRKGYARALYQEAKRKFRVFHSTNLSEDGKAFAKAVN